MNSRSEARTRHESHAIVQIRVFGGLFMCGEMQSPGRLGRSLSRVCTCMLRRSEFVANANDIPIQPMEPAKDSRGIRGMPLDSRVRSI